MKITALLENTTERQDMQVEHGLSLYIEAQGKRILFDMGQTSLFSENARTLGIDLSKVDIALLSHGHYDHGGGLAEFLRINSHAPVYIHKDAFLPHYNGTEKYIGLDCSLKESGRIVFCDDECALGEGLRLYSCNRHRRPHPNPPSGLTELAGDRFVEDDFRHEQYLQITEQHRRVLISGCSHKGILNIVSWFEPDVLVGGFHFSKLALDSSLARAASELDGYKTEFYTCHCTGREQYEFMRKYMNRLHYISCGKQVNL